MPARAAPDPGPERPTQWRRYERAPRADGRVSACLSHRQGWQAAGPERVSVFQILNDCARAVRATCTIAYTPSCSYGADVAPAGHFDAVIEAHTEGPAFGAFAVRPTGGIAGCFFARCREEEPPAAPARQARADR